MVRSKRFMKALQKTKLILERNVTMLLFLEMFFVSDFKIIEAIVTSSGIVSRIQELTRSGHEKC